MEKRVLISRWLGPSSQSIPIYDEASVSSARQRVRDVGQRFQFSKDVIESVALIASELTHNHLRHALQGYISVAPIQRGAIRGLQITAADRGPGIPEPDRALKNEPRLDGPGLGAGLSAVCRIADEVDFDNRIAEGLCVTARKFEKPSDLSHHEFAIMGRPFPGEIISGDDGAFFPLESGFIAVVADGLGHGPEAREASNRAIESLSRRREADLEHTVLGMNDDLAETRGCALSISRFNAAEGILECVSVGDVHTHLYAHKDAHFFTATPMVIGGGPMAKRRIRVEVLPVTPLSVLVMFTDGLKSKTTLKGQLDVLRQPAIAIAQHLLENHARPDDDALVLVARLPS